MSLSALAQSLGLSTSTVSRALNGYADVSATTRARVQAAALAIGYAPHPMAHRLATGRTGAVALVASMASGNYLNSTFAQLLSGVAQTLREHSYFAMSLVLPTGDNELPELKRLLDARLVDGVLLARTRTHDPRVSLLQERGMPFVTHGRTQTNLPHAWVDTDNEQAFVLATERLIALGHRRIALINAPTHMTFAALREQGFLKTLQRHGLDAAQCPVFHGDVTSACGEQIASKYIAETPSMTRLRGKNSPKSERVTAFLCATDAMALGAMAAIRQAGGVVGRDMSVVGYGNAEAGLYSDPPLTTIDHGVVSNGHHLAKLLLRRMAGEPPEQLTQLEAVKLIVRASDGPCREGA